MILDIDRPINQDKRIALANLVLNDLVEEWRVSSGKGLHIRLKKELNTPIEDSKRQYMREKFGRENTWDIKKGKRASNWQKAQELIYYLFEFER